MLLKQVNTKGKELYLPLFGNGPPDRFYLNVRISVRHQKRTIPGWVWFFFGGLEEIRINVFSAGEDIVRSRRGPARRETVHRTVSF